MEARIARLEAREEVNNELIEKLTEKVDSMNKVLIDLVASDKAKAKLISIALTAGPAIGVGLAKLFS